MNRWGRRPGEGMPGGEEEGPASPEKRRWVGKRKPVNGFGEAEDA